jgi:hypothetical protein
MVKIYKRYVMKAVTLLILLMPFAPDGVWGQTRQLIPTSFESQRFFATPLVGENGTLRLLVDTSGPSLPGMYVLSHQATSRLKLPTVQCNFYGTTLSLTEPFPSAPTLPVAKQTPCHSVAFVDSRIDTMSWDGELGASYLMGFVWTFDYPKKQLWHEPDSWKPSADMHATPIGLVKNSRGENAGGVPRITVVIYDQPIDVALETGAPTFTIKLQGDTQPTYSGSSYLAKSTIDQLLHDHPDCCSVLMGDHQNRMIEIRKIKIAGWLIGPVWFAEVPDTNFSRNVPGLGQLVDKPIHGVAGPNIFDHFAMTLDYQTDYAWFDCASGCAVADK